jgi:shikimate kinase/3-dehydroquinate synthase
MIALIGFMGAGKTTVGHILSERLGAPFVDSDVFIEQRLGRTVRSVFEHEGEAYFRDIEHTAVAELVRGTEAVVALGGGAVEDVRTRAVLRDARVVYLKVGFDEALVRVKGDEFRPLLRRPGLNDLYQHRSSIYESLAAITVQTDGRRPGAIAMDVLAELTRLPTTPPGT